MTILLRLYGLGMLLAGLLALRAAIGKDRETLIRCATLSVMLSVLALALASGTWGITLLCAVLAVLAFDELGRAKADKKPWIMGMGCMTAALLLLLPLMQSGMLAVLLCAVSLLAMCFAFVRFLVSTSVHIDGLAAIALHVVCGLAAIPLMCAAGGAGRFLALIFLLQFNDGFAYLVGRKWGRTPFAPTISPRKSVEGAIGGLTATALGAIVMRTPLLPVFSEYPKLHAAGLILIIVGFGISGDLLYSLVKRRANLKDFAARLPGHGGVLDRLDSLLAVAPMALLWNFLWS